MGVEVRVAVGGTEVGGVATCALVRDVADRSRLHRDCRGASGDEQVITGMSPRSAVVVAVGGPAHRTLERPPAGIHDDDAGPARSRDLLCKQRLALTFELCPACRFGGGDLGVELHLEVVDRLLHVGLLRFQLALSGIEAVRDLLLLLAFLLELRFLVAEVLVDRRELPDHVTVGLVCPVEQLRATHGLYRVSGAEHDVEAVAGVLVRVQRALGGDAVELRSLRPRDLDCGRVTGDVVLCLLELVIGRRELRGGGVGLVARGSQPSAGGVKVVFRRAVSAERRYERQSRDEDHRENTAGGSHELQDWMPGDWGTLLRPISQRKTDWIEAFWQFVKWSDVAERFARMRSLDLV